MESHGKNGRKEKADGFPFAGIARIKFRRFILSPALAKAPSTIGFKVVTIGTTYFSLLKNRCTLPEITLDR